MHGIKNDVRKNTFNDEESYPEDWMILHWVSGIIFSTLKDVESHEFWLSEEMREVNWKI